MIPPFLVSTLEIFEALDTDYYLLLLANLDFAYGILVSSLMIGSLSSKVVTVTRESFFRGEICFFFSGLQASLSSMPREISSDLLFF